MEGIGDQSVVVDNPSATAGIPPPPPPPPQPTTTAPPPPPPPPPKPAAPADPFAHLPPHLREIAAMKAKADAEMEGIGDQSVVVQPKDLPNIDAPPPPPPPQPAAQKPLPPPPPLPSLDQPDPSSLPPPPALPNQSPNIPPPPPPPKVDASESDNLDDSHLNDTIDKGSSAGALTKQISMPARPARPPPPPPGPAAPAKPNAFMNLMTALEHRRQDLANRKGSESSLETDSDDDFD